MKLLIPGPVTTRPEVRAAMIEDRAPWDQDFAPLTRSVRDRLLRIGGGTPAHAALILQGCGHFAMEAALRSFVPRGGRVLVPMTGHYADRLVRLAQEAGRIAIPLPVPADTRTDPHSVAAALRTDPAISHVAFVYSETSTGIVHDAAAIGAAVHACGRRVLLDAVSAFGALPVDLASQPEIDACVFTSNKCLEAMPGLGLVLVRGERLMACAGHAESWCFDLADSYRHTILHGEGFRFTPPAQVLAALAVALELLEAEGGAPARLARYQANAQALAAALPGIGLQPYLPSALQGPIVMNVRAPADPGWDLQDFVDALKSRGFLISNFHNTDRPSFRVGCIGALTAEDMGIAAAAMGESLRAMGIRLDQAA